MIPIDGMTVSKWAWSNLSFSDESSSLITPPYLFTTSCEIVQQNKTVGTNNSSTEFGQMQQSDKRSTIENRLKISNWENLHFVPSVFRELINCWSCAVKKIFLGRHMFKWITLTQLFLSTLERFILEIVLEQINENIPFWIIRWNNSRWQRLSFCGTCLQLFLWQFWQQFLRPASNLSFSSSPSSPPPSDPNNRTTDCTNNRC